MSHGPFDWLIKTLREMEYLKMSCILLIFMKTFVLCNDKDKNKD